MADPRIRSFAQTISKCLDIVEDDVVLIWSNENCAPLVLELQKQIYQRGAYPQIRINLEQMRYVLVRYGQEKHLRHFPPGLAREIEIATKFISIESVVNPNNLRNIDQKRHALWQQTIDPYQRKLDFTPTLVTIFPNVNYANNAGMCLEQYEDLFYQAVAVDLDKLDRDFYPIEQMLSRGNKFKIHTSNTELSFELGERNFAMHSLLINLPGGELYCAPLENSVNGYIRFEQPVTYQGKRFSNVYLEFRAGELVEFDSDSEKKALAEILATDPGASKVGEFGFGLNPALREFTNDILLDEKVTGSLHLALGDAHPEVGGTNRSTVHFDLVKDMRGDGEILMDGRVVYRDGRFCTF